MIAVTILLIISILFSRVTVNVLDFVLRVVFSCVYCDAVHHRWPKCNMRVCMGKIEFET